MLSPHGEWPAARVVHLNGGCRALNGFAPSCQFEPKPIGGKQLHISIRDYKSLYADLARLGLAPIGIDFLHNAADARGVTPHDWRTFHPWPKSVWPCNYEIDRYAQIAYAATQTKDIALWDMARRISHQLRVCAWRLRQISDAYRDQLHAKVASSDFQAGTRFEDTYTWLAYLAIQAFLVDACVLRDYLAEFYAQYACPDRGLVSGVPITSMAGLRKRVLGKLSTTHRLTADLTSATSPGGWLHKLGAYRDLVVHCVPLARSETRLLAQATELALTSLSPLPAVKLPIPEDPAAISKARAAGTHLTTIQEQLALLVRANRGDAPSSDGLVYAYIALDNLTRLAQALAEYSPVPPQVAHLTGEDLAGPIVVKRR